MRRLLSILVLLIPAGGLSAAPPKTEVDQAVERGLTYLRKTQLPDGSWSRASLTNSPKSGRPGGWTPAQSSPAFVNGHPVITSLAVMAFLSAGKVPGEGRDGPVIERGIRFVLSRQQPNGLIAEIGDGNTEMYCHGICTLMLAEVVGMTDARQADDLRKRLEAAVKLLLQAQRTTGPDLGGWRYRVTGIDSDLSVTGWQLLALRAARNVGCDVPVERIRSAVEYVRKCFDPSSRGFRYQIHGPVTVPCTGTGILAIELCGKEYHRCPEVLKAGEFILEFPLSPSRPHFFYGAYYTSQGMAQLGGTFASKYREQLHELLLLNYGPNVDGAWTGRGSWDDIQYGTSYCTAMAILALTVEYRLLPIYQRFEDPIEKDANDP